MSTKTLTNSQNIADQLHSAAIYLLRKLRKEDEGSGLNAPRLSALSVIVFGAPVTLRDLAAAEQVRPPTMTRIVNALEEKGLVLKKQNANDGRSTLLSATPAGKKLLIEGRVRRVRALAKQIAALNHEQRSALKEAAEILKEVVPHNLTGRYLESVEFRGNFTLLAMQGEVHTYCGCDFNRHAVDLVGPIAPVSNCILGCTPQQAVTFDNVQFFHSSILGDHSLHHHIALRTCEAGECWIRRLRTRHKIRRHDA